MNSSQALVGPDRRCTPANGQPRGAVAASRPSSRPSCRRRSRCRRCHPGRDAFRLRDEAGLIDTLRLLAQAAAALLEARDDVCS